MENTVSSAPNAFAIDPDKNAPSKIARMLKAREIPTPGTICFQRTGQTSRYHPDDPCLWSKKTVSDILAQDAYLGRTTCFKYSKPSFKSKKTVVNPPEKRIICENTHPAIIDSDTWEIVQRNREQRKRPIRQEEIGLFSGLAICAGCGKRLYLNRAASMKHEQESYTCGTYRRFHNQCSAHYIRVVVLEELVLQNLQRVVAYAQENESEFARRVMENKLAAQRTEQEQSKRKLGKQKRRITELDAIIQRLYEDSVSGKLILIPNKNNQQSSYGS